jgi:hypothetical protein
VNQPVLLGNQPSTENQPAVRRVLLSQMKTRTLVATVSPYFPWGCPFAELLTTLQCPVAVRMFRRLAVIHPPSVYFRYTASISGCTRTLSDYRSIPKGRPSNARFLSTPLGQRITSFFVNGCPEYCKLNCNLEACAAYLIWPFVGITPVYAKALSVRCRGLRRASWSGL